jgi:molybdopterin synthase catalytic subunit
MKNPGSGAIVLFSGDVRDFNSNKNVSHLEYESNETLAEKQIALILKEAIEKWGLHFAHAVHRLGRVEVSDSAVIVATASAHRKEAYDANLWIINRIKHQVPIWKKEYYTDGNYEWILQCNHNYEDKITV